MSQETSCHILSPQFQKKGREKKRKDDYRDEGPEKLG